MALTPLLIMAGEGLLASTALRLNPNIDISTYTTQPFVLDYLATIAAFEADEYEPAIFPSPGNPNGMSVALINSFIHALDNTTPFLTNVMPTAQSIGTRYFDTFLNHHLSTNMFATNGQFVSYCQIAMGQKEISNAWVNSAVNGAKLTEQTFTSMDALMSGNISAVSTAVNEWGQELVNTGKLFNFTKIDSMGTPQALVESLMQVNVLTSLADELDAQGINVNELQKIINGNPDATLPASIQKSCYDAFTNVTGDQLEQILFVLEIETSGITVLSDLLDLTKLFPATFTTITSLNNGSVENIYITPTGDIADYVKAFANPVATAMPSILAKANYAFTIALGQIKGIMDSTPQQIGDQAIGIEGNDGLAATGGLDEALPEETTNGIIAEMGGGSGPDSTFYLTDFVGSVAGIPHVDNIDIMNTVIDALESENALADMSQILVVMRNVLGGAYVVADPAPEEPPEDYETSYHIEIPPGLPAAGRHANRAQAINRLIAELKAAALALVSAYPTETSDATEAFNGSIGSIKTELAQLWEAELRFEVTYVSEYETSDPLRNGLPEDKKTTLGFAENLHSFGKKTDKGNIAVILEALAASNQGGDAIVAAMREGRNLAKLSAAGIQNDAQISDQPLVVEPGNIT